MRSTINALIIAVALLPLVGLAAQEIDAPEDAVPSWVEKLRAAHDNNEALALTVDEVHGLWDELEALERNRVADVVRSDRLGVFYVISAGGEVLLTIPVGPSISTAPPPGALAGR